MALDRTLSQDGLVDRLAVGCLNETISRNVLFQFLPFLACTIVHALIVVIDAAGGCRGALILIVLENLAFYLF